MKNIRGLLALLLVFIMVAQVGILGVSAAVTVDSNGQPTKYSTEYNSGTRNVIANTLSGTSAASYYTGNYTYAKLAVQSGDTLYNSLHTLMKNTHSYTSSYDDCHYKADRTDCENESGNVSLIFTGYSATMEQWNGWNREHVWPKSRGGDSTTGGGADLHHIRPADAYINGTPHNSRQYGNVDNGTSGYGRNPATGYLGGYYTGSQTDGTFEPLDNVKGDIARICLYVYVRWGSDWGATSITKVFESVDVLLEWCELDPVDTWELGRNEVVQDIQGNRNVFIDYPEYAWLLFNREIPEDMPTPSKGNSTGVTSPTNATEAPTEAPTTAPTTPSVDPSVTGSATISFTSTANRISWDAQQQVWYQNGITVTNDKANSQTNVANYSNPARFYKNSKLTIEATNMKQIAFVCNSSSYATALKGSISNNTAYSVSVNDNVVTITLNEAVNRFVIDSLSGGQVRIDSITVECEVTTPDNPGTDDPGTDNPGTDTPGTDTPGTDNSGTSDSKKEPTGFMAWLLAIINAILAIFGLRMEI